MYRIRKITSKDIEALKWLHETVLPADVLPDFSVGYWWICEYIDKNVIIPVGFGGLRHLGFNMGYLNRSGVRFSHRGHGIQKKLISVREKFARTLGITKMITDTSNNPASSNSLISKGYKLYTPEKPWGYSYTLYWTKKL